MLKVEFGKVLSSSIVLVTADTQVSSRFAPLCFSSLGRADTAQQQRLSLSHLPASKGLRDFPLYIINVLGFSLAVWEGARGCWQHPTRSTSQGRHSPELLSASKALQ